MNSDIQTEKKVRYFKVLVENQFTYPLGKTTYYKIKNNKLYFNDIDVWNVSDGTVKQMFEAIENKCAREVPLEELVLMGEFKIL